MGGKEALTGSGKEMFADHIKWIKGAETGTLFLLAFVPNPFFDVAGIAAGALGIPKWRFFIPVLLGKIARFIILASLGAHMLPPGIN
jgi:membrane protein YqaA with SNARE-associated domain